jgi:hypothetical protein
MKKDYLIEKAYNIASEFTDKDLLFIIIELINWYKERIKTPQEKIDAAIELLEKIPINATGGDILEIERKIYHILRGDEN